MQQGTLQMPLQPLEGRPIDAYPTPGSSHEASRPSVSSILAPKTATAAVQGQRAEQKLGGVAERAAPQRQGGRGKSAAKEVVKRKRTSQNGPVSIAMAV